MEFDPSPTFSAPGWIETPTHRRVLDTLKTTVRSENTVAVLLGPPGVGKSTILERFRRENAGPDRTFARVSAPWDETELFGGLARAAGVVPQSETTSEAWRALRHAWARTAVQESELVLLVDGLTLLDPWRETLERLAHLDPEHPPSIVVTARSCQDPGDAAVLHVPSLTRSESIAYLQAKLSRSRPFTERALTRLHALTGGLPRALERLARAAEIETEAWGEPTVTTEWVDVAFGAAFPNGWESEAA